MVRLLCFLVLFLTVFTVKILMAFNDGVITLRAGLLDTWAFDAFIIAAAVFVVAEFLDKLLDKYGVSKND